jgi:hypothetical protein
MASFPRLLILLHFATALIPASVFAFDADYLAQLQQQALQQQLHTNPYWHRLLHYEADKLGSGYTSLIDSPDFFIADDGRTNPSAELQATLAGFFTNIEIARQEIEQPLQCAYIARFHWLAEQLQFDGQRLPSLPCKDFDEWISTIAPANVTLVLPSAYLNNPSSMFGHTFLRIDKAGQSETSQLVAYSINYAARTDESSGMVFAYKGLVGGYQGYFSVLPYYEKVNEYNDLENRDIWEYSLNLTYDEILQMLRHAWELDGIYFDYYFVDENCSFQLLGLLQVARPGFEFTAEFPLWATPVDTLRTVLSEEDLLAAVTYRPSAQTRLEHQSGFLTGTETDLVLDLVYGRREPGDAAIAKYSPERQALMLETAFDYLQYLHNEQVLDRDQMAQRSINLLKLRSRIDASSPATPVPVPGHSPDQGHQSSRLALRLGHFEGSGYAELALRPAYHDLLDNRAGYVRGSQLNFFNIELRYTDDSSDFELQRLDVFDAFSLSPRSAFFDPLSWKLKAGLERRYSPDELDDRLVTAFEGGIGPAWQLGQSLTFFALLDGTIWVQSHIPDDYALGVGANLGLHWPVSDRWNLMLSARSRYFVDNLHATIADYEASANYSLSRDSALRLTVHESGEAGDMHSDVAFGFNWYL